MKKRILFVISGLKAGGVEITLKNTIRMLNTKKYEVVGVVSISDEKENFIHIDIKQKGFKVWFLGCNKATQFIDACVQLEHLIKDEKIDMVHSFMFHANIISRCAVQFKKDCKLINAQRNIDVWRKWYHNWVDLFSSHVVDKFICCSYAVKDDFVKRTGIDSGKCVVAHNGVNTKKFPKIKHHKKKEYTIGTVASLTPQKGFHYFLYAAKELLALRKDVRFVILGDGPLKDELKQLAKKLKIDDKVNFIGVQDSTKWFRNFDIFWLTSAWEGLGNVVLEAGVSRIPVVAHRVDGIPEMIEHGENGYLVTKGHTTRVAYLTNRLLDDVKAREAMGESAKKNVEQNFSLNNHVRKIIQTWDEVFDDE